MDSNTFEKAKEINIVINNLKKAIDIIENPISNKDDDYITTKIELYNTFEDYSPTYILDLTSLINFNVLQGILLEGLNKELTKAEQAFKDL